MSQLTPYIAGLIQSNNLGKFYRYVNGKIYGRKSIPPIKNNAGNLVTDKAVQANIFNGYFASVLHMMTMTNHIFLIVWTLTLDVVMLPSLQLM